MGKLQIQKKTRKVLKKADKLEPFIRDLQTLLKSLVDKKATKNYQRIIPETGKFYGVPKPILWVIASEISKFIQKEPTKAEVLLRTIWNEGSYEAKQTAGKSLEKFSPKNPKLCLNFISFALPDIDNWSLCDSLAMYAVKPIVFSNPKLVLPFSEKWVKDNRKWVRRFGIVTLLGYKKIQTTDKVFKILGLVMEDEDKDIKKAASWILREITKKNPDEVAKFLIRWVKTKPGKDTKWIILDGMKKLSGDKQKEILRLLSKTEKHASNKSNKKTFVEICIYEVVPERVEVFENLIEKVAKHHCKFPGVKDVRYVKRTHRPPNSFTDVKTGKPPIRLTRKPKKVTYVLYWELSGEVAHGKATASGLNKFYKEFRKILGMSRPKIILGERIQFI